MTVRTERDSIGTRELPFDAYYGINALRSKENFDISGQRVDLELIQSIALIKKAAALVNAEDGKLSGKSKEAIIKACDELMGPCSEPQSKALLDSVIVDPFQGGAGTSINMNINEVIANRAIEMIGGRKGDYNIVHPNDHVNLSQSTNDVIPSAIKLASYRLCVELEGELKKLFMSFLDKSTQFMDIIKVGRTQMQDAVPISLGQEFFAYADATRRNLELVRAVKGSLKELNMGGTAIGTSVNASEYFVNNIVPKIAELSGIDFIQSENLIDSTQNVDCYITVSGALKACSSALSKIANDLRLMSSGPRSGFAEINLPAVQSGSSIMPGKVNPVIPEIVNQMAFRVIGNDQTITLAAESGQLELNAFIPVIACALLDSLKIMIKSIKTFREHCVNGITANDENCQEILQESMVTVTALCPYIGYDKAVWVAKKAMAERRTIKDVVLSQKLLDEKKIDRILNPKKMI